MYCTSEHWSYNYFHNILRLFDALPNVPFTTSEMMRDYYFETRYVRISARVVKRFQSFNLRKLGNTRKVSKPHRMIAQHPAPPAKIKTLQTLARNSWKTETNP